MTNLPRPNNYHSKNIYTLTRFGVSKSTTLRQYFDYLENFSHYELLAGFFLFLFDRYRIRANGVYCHSLARRELPVQLISLIYRTNNGRRLIILRRENKVGRSDCVRRMFVRVNSRYDPNGNSTSRRTDRYGPTVH